MTFDEFTESLEEATPPVGLSTLLQVLWFDANDDWQRAHDIVQAHEDKSAFDRLHAYLHRKEGDLTNADYWYRRAGQPTFDGSLYDEWLWLVEAYLADPDASKPVA